MSSNATYDELKAHMGHQLYVECRTGEGRAVLRCSTCKTDVLSVGASDRDLAVDLLEQRRYIIKLENVTTMYRAQRYTEAEAALIELHRKRDMGEL